MNVSYSREQRREALRVYRRTGSVTKRFYCWVILGVGRCINGFERRESRFEA